VCFQINGVAFEHLVWCCVSEDFCVTILCYDCYRYRNHMHLKIIDHMNRITIYVHDITEHYPENVLSGLKKRLKDMLI